MSKNKQLNQPTVLPGGRGARRDTRMAILGAAARKFRENGYAAVSLRDIAKSAGLTTGSLYYHFGSKDEVVEEVLKFGHINSRLAVERALAESPAQMHPLEQIRCAVRAHIMCLFGQDSLPSANIRIFAQVPTGIAAASMASRHAYEALWKGLFEAAKSDGSLKQELDVELAVPLIFGAMNWTIEWFDPTRHDLEQVITQIVGLLSIES